MNTPPHFDCFIALNETNEEEIKKQLIPIINTTCGDAWSKVTVDDVQFKSFGTGMTNRIYRVRRMHPIESDSDDDISSSIAVPLSTVSIGLLIRIYGKSTELFIDRTNELRLIVHMGTPKVYATFDNGYIHEFIPGNGIDMKQFRDSKMHPLMMEELVRWHQTPLYGSLDLGDVNKGESFLWLRIEKWFQMTKKLIAKNGSDSLAAKVLGFINDFEQHFNDTKNIVEKTFDKYQDEKIAIYTRKACVCHNDTTLGNWLLNDRISATLIDVEYGGVMCRGAELANFYCEMAGVECQYDQYFPSIEKRKSLTELYLTVCEENFENELKRNVEIMTEIIDTFVIANNLQWTLWGVMQKLVSDLDEDYNKYALCRIEEFHKRINLMK